MLSVTVEGGTRAGRRPAFQGTARPWPCLCAIPVCCGRPTETGDCCYNPEPEQCIQPGYMAACSDCGERRPA